MENFIYEEKFCSGIEDLMIHLDIEDDQVSQLDEDWSVDCYETEQQPIIQLSSDWIMQFIDQDRFPEDEENCYERMEKMLNQNIDFDKVNALVPKLFYQTKKKFIITKQDLIDTI